MTLEEKLDHFTQYTMDEAWRNHDAVVNRYREALEQVFAEHREARMRTEELEIKAETARIVRENNKRFSDEQMVLRQSIRRRQSELKKKIFAEVREVVETFRSTPEYRQLLLRELKAAYAYAGGEEVVLYVDPADAALAPELEAEVGAAVTVSGEPFAGGTRAVIPGRNILIDNSFETKLAEAEENFRLKGGSGHGE